MRVRVLLAVLGLGIVGSASGAGALTGAIGIATGTAEQDRSFNVTLRNLLIVGRLPAGDSEIQVRAKAAEVIVDNIIEGDPPHPAGRGVVRPFELTGASPNGRPFFALCGPSPDGDSMITPVTRMRFAAACEASLNGQYLGFMPLRFEVGLQGFPLTRFIATIGLFGIGSDDLPL